MKFTTFSCLRSFKICISRSAVMGNCNVFHQVMQILFLRGSRSTYAFSFVFHENPLQCYEFVVTFVSGFEDFAVIEKFHKCHQIVSAKRSKTNSPERSLADFGKNFVLQLLIAVLNFLCKVGREVLKFEDILDKFRNKSKFNYDSRSAMSFTLIVGGNEEQLQLI